MRNTTPENEKATAPVPAVGAAGEQSNNKLTNDTITEKAGERNLRHCFSGFLHKKRQRHG